MSHSFVCSICMCKMFKKIHKAGFSHYRYGCAVNTIYSFVLSSTFYTGHALISTMRRKKKKCAWEGQEGGEIGSCLTAAAGDFRFPSARWCPTRAGRELKLIPAGADCISQRINFSLCCTGKFCSLSALMLATALVIPLLAHILPSHASPW